MLKKPTKGLLKFGIWAFPFRNWVNLISLIFTLVVLLWFTAWTLEKSKEWTWMGSGWLDIYKDFDYVFN